MRNYQYTPEEEAEMDAFGNEWKKTNRGIKGPSAWREFKQRHPWARAITADALRQKYVRMKCDQYWKSFAILHAACPMGHTTCVAGTTHIDYQGTIASLDNYISRSTETLNPSLLISVCNSVPTSPLSTAIETSDPSVVVEDTPLATNTSAAPTVSADPSQAVETPLLASTSAVPTVISAQSVAVVNTPLLASTPAVPTVISAQSVAVENTPLLASTSGIPTVSSTPVAVNIGTVAPSVSTANTRSISAPRTPAFSCFRSAPAVNNNAEDVVEDDIPVELPPVQVGPSQPLETPSDSDVLVDAIDNDLVEDELQTDDETEDLKTAIPKSETNELFERVLQVIDGKLVPTRIDGSMMLIPRNKDSNISPIAVREVLEQAKRVLMEYLDEKYNEFKQKHPNLTNGNNNDSLSEMIKQLKLYLVEEIDKLIARLLEHSK